MSTVGQIERKTQNRIVKLFKDQLGYEYLGNWEEREQNQNIETTLLDSFLKKQGNDPAIISRAIHAFQKAASDQSKSLYDRNKEVYTLLRYGVQVRPEVGENTQTIYLIDWKHPSKNHFAIAEEVTVLGRDAKSFAKRPDLVIYVNGIALGVIELKRSTVSVAEGIRQNLDNQDPKFIEHFFSTLQLVMAGNDSQGLRYGTIKTREKNYLTWKEDSEVENLLDRHVNQVCNKERFLELIHDFVVFDSGIKKLCRQNQYFGVKAAHDFIRRREGGVIWHTQGSGKSLTMVWLTKWIRENVKDARVLIVTDRTELDSQIEKVFKGVNESIHRTKNGADLIEKLNTAEPWLMCSLIHKFGGKDENDDAEAAKDYVNELKKALPTNFKAKGDLYIFVDECHRTQSGNLHDAMKLILPSATFIGFTGTPLLKADKKKSIEIFGKYIHTYKFDEAVADGVVLDLRYEARDIDQQITSQNRIDEWFEAKTKGLTDLAKAQLKQRWGTLKTILSCQNRLEKIVADVIFDMGTKTRLMDGRGNAMLGSGSIYQACKFYELFSKTELAGKCAIITSYKPSPSDLKGEHTGEGLTEKLNQYEIYQKMLGDWFKEAPEKAVSKAERFEDEVKKKFIDEPSQMKLLIVVDKLLTGFDAPSATYLYIDKEMRDHGLFQAICRVNRLDGDDKEYGYIIDYKDLFRSIEGAVKDYTSGALDGYSKDDVEGLLKDRLQNAREDLEDAREDIKAICSAVLEPKDTPSYIHFFCAKDSGNIEQLKENEPKRLTLYKAAAKLLRSFANIANEMTEAGYSPTEIEAVKLEVAHFESVRNEVKLASCDYIDLKMYEPAMRHLIDAYIKAEDSEKISSFDDLSLVDLLVKKGVDGVKDLPNSIKKSPESVSEVIENNVRKVIVDEQPVNPKYYEKMSELLDNLIDQRRKKVIDYQKYLEEIVKLAEKVKNPTMGSAYPKTLDTSAKRAFYDNLDKDESIALAVYKAVIDSKQDDFRGNNFKLRRVRKAINEVLNDETKTGTILEIVIQNHEF